MKKIIVLLLAIAMSASTALAGDGIVGSAHDMTMYPGISDPEGRVCAFCHTPHHADTVSGDYMPLWSREWTQVASFTQYDSGSLQATITDPMVGPSILCMSCHDGAVAPDAYYGNPGTVALLEGDAYGEFGVGLAGDMSNDHPIGFDYTTVAAGTNTWGVPDGTRIGAGGDGEIRMETEDLSGFGVYGINTIADVLWNADNSGLGGGKIFTCASCHDVHNGPTAVENHFLYGPQQDSQFCRMCHLK